MTTDEQATGGTTAPRRTCPLCGRYEHGSVACYTGATNTLDVRVPAPEETMETTEECPSCIECAGTGEVFDREDDTRVCDRCNGTGNEPEPPAPEPAGEVEERLYQDALASLAEAKAGGRPTPREELVMKPAPSSGTPGLTEARIIEEAERRFPENEPAYAGRSMVSHEVRDLREAFEEGAEFGVAEARAPLEARIEELLKWMNARPATIGRLSNELAAVTAERDEARANAVVQVANAASEMLREAERQRDEALAALAKARDAVVLMASKSRVRSRNIDNFPASYEISVGAYEALHEAYYDAERALTSPASTAKGDKDAE